MKKISIVKKILAERLAFSLIEVLLALTIFAIGILGVMSLQGIALMSSDFSGQMSVARLLASDQIERLGTLPYSAAALDDCGLTAWCYKDSGNGVAGAQSSIDNMGAANGQGRFRREWSVDIVDTNVKQVDVRVFWTDVPGATGAAAGSFNRSLQLSTTKVNPE